MTVKSTNNFPFFLSKTKFILQYPAIMIGFCDGDGDGWADPKYGYENYMYKHPEI